MKTDKNLKFITKSIKDAGQAIVYRNFAGQNKQAIAIKRDFTVDENGLIHFSVISQYEENITTDVFPVELLFYKKGFGFYITAKGIAERTASHESKEVAIRMDFVEFVKTAPVKHHSYFNSLLEKANKITAFFM